MSNIQALCIESLPDEIFLSILSYFYFDELFPPWHQTDLKDDSSDDDEQGGKVKYLSKWGDTIACFKDYRAEHENYKGTIEGQYSNICSANFPYLQRLDISNYETPFPFWERILFKDNPFPFLTTITGVQLEEDENFQMDKTTTTMIQHVGFSHQLKLPFVPFITFISRLPNLISLRANVAEFTRAVPPPQIITKIRHMSIFLQQKTM
ncbi:unnamed protein product [Adineta ricciae]|uniref:Uncharacterized protein n=1 Tax=Adineta ricciae TaxID=249248 RepID=A0A814VM14_ADIRI|nr:unnamed protein product [Adineta ricciae]